MAPLYLVVITLVLALAKLAGAPLPWYVVTAPLWVPIAGLVGLIVVLIWASLIWVIFHS